VELLMKLCAESIKDNEPVWFGCDVNKRLIDKHGIHDIKAYNFELMFGTDIHVGLSKADRLLYGDSMMVHAMAFTAVSIDREGKIKKFRIENSWGEDHGQKGYQVVSTEWFADFVFEAVVDKKIRTCGRDGCIQSGTRRFTRLGSHGHARSLMLKRFN